MAELKERTAQLEQLLLDTSPTGPFCMGPRLSLADLGFAPAFFYIDLILPVITADKRSIDWPPRVRALQAALAGRLRNGLLPMPLLLGCALAWVHGSQHVAVSCCCCQLDLGLNHTVLLLSLASAAL